MQASSRITRFVATKHPVGQNIRWMLHPHTLPVAAGQCYIYIITANWTDRATHDERGGMCLWEVKGRADMRVGGRVSLQYPLISLPPRRPPPPSGAGTRTDVRVGDPVRGGARWLPARCSTAHEDDAAALLRIRFMWTLCFGSYIYWHPVVMFMWLI